MFASGDELGASFTSELEPRLGVDPLSGYFLFVLGVVGAPAVFFATRYLAPDAPGRITAALTGVFLLVLALVLCARDPLTFLAAWELMTLVPAGIILVGRRDREARSSVYAYIGLTHLMGAGTWIAVLLLADAGAFGGGDAIEAGSGTQIAIAVAALVGMGTKAGLVPLHTWLPRAHPIAPAHISALMSGVMIKLAVYGLVRILVEWLGELPAWYGMVVLAVGGASAVIGVVYAIFQHELKRLLAFHSIENVGIIVLGLGACLLLHTRGADTAAGVALAAALLHTLNHAVFKGLLFLGAGAFERAAGSLEIDRLGGLLQRMPWTGGAFLVGAMAIAGLPPLNGFASEWLTLQSLFAVPASGGVAEGLAGALALGALAATAALAVLCFVKVVGLVLLGQPRRARIAEATDAPFPMRAAVVVLAAACIVLGIVPGALAGPLAGLAPWPTDDAPSAALEVPWGDALPTPGIALVLLVGTAASGRSAGKAARSTRAQLGVWSAGRTRARLDECRVHEAAATRARGGAPSHPRHLAVGPRRRPPGGALRGTRPASLRNPSQPPGHTGGALGRGTRAARAEREPDRVRRVPGRARDRPARSGADRGDRVSGASVGAAGAQLVGGLVLAPLIPGLIQHWKARLQGRRGPSPLQPYRELARLWSRSSIDVERTTLVYRLAPPVVAAALVAAVLLVPVAADAPNLGVGHSMLALGGLLALARFTVCTAAWDTENGFALMGASRDLTVSVFTEAALVLSLAVAALVAGTTDLTGIVAGTAGSDSWTSPGLALGAVGFALVVLAETGRQPFDNPDTHLELTMIHEGPVLEFGGRDLALLQWSAAARHWVVLVLAAQIFVPHAESVWLQLALLPVVLVVLCGALALVETLVAKMRILLAPRLVGVGAAAALLGVLTWLIETT